MAQVQTVQGNKRYRFQLNAVMPYTGRITAIAISKQNNVLVCHYDNNKLLFGDRGMGFTKTLCLDSNPWDIAVSASNIAYVTLPNIETVLIVDPVTFCICSRNVLSNTAPNVFCVSALPREDKVYLGCNTFGKFKNVYLKNGAIAGETKEVSGTEIAVKYHVCITKNHLSEYSQENHVRCVAGQDQILFTSVDRSGLNIPSSHSITIPSLSIPSDMCSDDNGHIYVSGQDSNNIARLTYGGNFVDILGLVPINIFRPYSLSKPVALCFNSDYSTFYCADANGVQIF